MNHTVAWTTEPGEPTCPDLTQYLVSIETPQGDYVGSAFVPLGTQSYDFDLLPGDYIEKVAGANADASVREGEISRAFTVAENHPLEPFPFPAWTRHQSGARPSHPIVLPPDIIATPGPPVEKTTWESNMLHWGTIHGDYLSTNPTVDEKLNHVYYDMSRVMYQIADYTAQDEPWNSYAKQAMKWFRDEYVIPNAGAVPGYQNFTTGLRLDFERTGDVGSKDAAILLSHNAMYAADWTDRNYVTHHCTNREVAYAILSYINAEKLGEAKRPIRAEWVTVSHTYFAQWYDVTTWEGWQISPFMCAITAQALIADWEETQDARCLPALTELAAWLWTAAYDPVTHALLYQLNPDNTSEGGLSTQGAPDLNMIIAPLYSWLWQQTGDSVHRDRFDELLLGQANAYLAQGKQFDQNYWWAFQGMRWRESSPVTRRRR